MKNIFVFAGAFFSHRWNLATLAPVGLAFAGFCAMASAVYVWNDLLDVEADRRHATKRKRPIASGEVSIREAHLVAGSLAIGGALLAYNASLECLALLLAYAAMNVCYSIRLKHVVIVDVFTIAGGFMLRILAGTVGVGIEPSSWLLLCGLMVTLFLGFSKRRAELISNPNDQLGSTRVVLSSYNPAVVEQFQSITAACTILTYALYTVAPETIALHKTNRLIYTVPFIVYGIFRYMFLLHAEGSGQDTARDLVRDKHLLGTTFAWIFSVIWLLR